MQRFVRIVDGHKRPVTGAPVVFVCKGDRYETVSGRDGAASFDCDADWLSELKVNDRTVMRDVDLSGGWGSPKKDLGTVQVGAENLRTVRVRYDDGAAASGKTVMFVKGGDRQAARTGSGGAAQIPWEPDWIDSVLVDGASVATDIDLSGGWFGGAKTNLDDIVLLRSAAGTRRLRLTYRDGEPVSKREVAFFRWVEDEQGKRAVTDTDGRVSFTWPYDWMGRLEVEQLVVKRDWDLSSMTSGQRDDLGTVEVPRPEQANLNDGKLTVDAAPFEEGQEQGVRGYVFYRDGTLCYESFKVEVEFKADFEETSLYGHRFSSQDPRSYCRDDGEFFIATPRYRAKKWVAKVYVDSDEIPRQMFFRTTSGSYVIVLPPKFMRAAKGTKGGLITGMVVDADGTAADNSKVRVEVVSSGFLSSGQTSETFTDKKGHFALPFTGGTRIKRMYVDGSEPIEISVGKGDNVRQVPITAVTAGMFNLRIVRKKRSLWGLL